jgi:RNA polymerase sigma-70 factor (ECF subfamily)
LTESSAFQAAPPDPAAGGADPNPATASDIEGLSDSALVGRALAGDENAFEALLARYRALVFVVAYRQLGVEEGVEDAAQEAFFRAFAHLAELDDPARFKTWLLRITANIALDHLRRRKNKEISLEREDVREAAEAHGVAQRAAAADDDSQLRSRIVDAIYALPPDYQMPAVMRWLEGLPYREIGRRLGVREDALRKRIHRAGQMLRRRLHDLGPRDGTRTGGGG